MWWVNFFISIAFTKVGRERNLSICISCNVLHVFSRYIWSSLSSLKLYCKAFSYVLKDSLFLKFSGNDAKQSYQIINLGWLLLDLLAIY